MSEGEPGVFERLPRRRPSLRTPRRDRRRADFSAEAEQPEPRAEPKVEFEADEQEASGREHRGFHPKRRVEDLTLSGIGAAADAVVLGLKLIERAYGGVRGTVDRDRH